MSTARALPQSEPAILLHGTVKGREGELLLIADGAGLLAARRAKSCLVEPQPGERVLVSAAAGECFVLAVLDGATETRLAVEGPLVVSSATSLALAAPQISAVADEAEHRFGRARFSAGRLDATLDSAKLTLERLHTLASDVLAEIGHSIRRVAGMEHLSAGQIDQRAVDTASLHARFTSVTADKDVRIDGNQIHMG